MGYTGLGAVVYPQLTGAKSLRAQSLINAALKRRTKMLLRRQGGGSSGVSLWGGPQLQLNKDGILSLTIDIYSYRQHAAHGLTMRTALTFDLTTGRNYTLSELFKVGADYITPVSEEIKRQIVERELPLLRDFVQIAPNQEYYLRETYLVIYFQTYDYTPYFVGMPEFRIPLQQLQELAAPQGPLARLADDRTST